MSIILQICKKYKGKYEQEEKSGNTPKGKVVFKRESGKFSIGKNQFEIHANYHGGILQGAGQTQITLSVENFKKKKLLIYPRSTFDKVIDLVLGRKRKNIYQSVKNYYQFEGDKNLILDLNKEQNFIDLLRDNDLCLYLRSNHFNKLILRPNRGINKEQQLEEFIKILEIVKKYCD